MNTTEFKKKSQVALSIAKEKTKLFFAKTLDIVSKYSISLKSYAQEKSAYYYDKFKKWLLGSNTFTIGFVLCFTHIIFIEPTRETYMLLSIIALVSIAKPIYAVESFRYDCIKKKFDHWFYVHNDRLEQFNIKSKVKTLKTACLILSVMYWSSVINLLFLFLSKTPIVDRFYFFDGTIIIYCFSILLRYFFTVEIPDIIVEDTDENGQKLETTIKTEAVITGIDRLKEIFKFYL